MDTGAVLPAGLGDMPPGPALAAALSTVDRATLTGPQLAVVLVAQGRQVAHEQARLLADAVELGRIPWDGPGPVTREQSDEYSADQIAFTLTISRWAAQKLRGLGESLLDRLPMVYEALLAGRIDYPRAMAFSEVLCHLDDDTARALATATLSTAERWTASQLRQRLTYRAHKADPGLAKRRYRHSVTDRRVYIGLTDDGTARLSGLNLPVDRAAAAENRLERLARAAKADGDIRTLDQLRADAMLDVLAGEPFHLHPRHDPYTADADHQARTDDAAFKATYHGDGEAAELETAIDGEILPATQPTPGTESQPGLCTCGGVRPAQRRGVVDITVSLTTLLRLNDHPGWIPGWGTVLADIARHIAFDQATNPAWKYSITNNSGHLLHHGHIQRRPTATETAFVQARDQTCQAPGCTRPANRCDLDHLDDYAKGGPSHRGNLGPECEHHHMFKHHKNFTLHPHGPATNGVIWEAPDRRLYFVPAEGNIVAIANAPDENGWDLDHAHPPREVRQIIPA